MAQPTTAHADVAINEPEEPGTLPPVPGPLEEGSGEEEEEESVYYPSDGEETRLFSNPEENELPLEPVRTPSSAWSSDDEEDEAQARTAAAVARRRGGGSARGGGALKRVRRS